jgi:Escherichia/Staphylococcus phage prohead protease
MEIERRMVEAADLRVMAEGPPRIVGHAALFDTLSDDLGGFRERIRPGAFAASLASDDVRALFNHDPNVILGRNRAGTLRLAEDAHGLAIEIDPPDTQAARDLMVSIARGDVSQMSFGFSVVAGGQTWEKDPEGRVLRTLTAVRLYDVSPVVFPAYPDTAIAVRALAAWRGATSRAPPVGLLRRRLDLALLDPI